MSNAHEISLPHFDGPLDLLLALVRKNEVEITDIPIAEITRQYLEYLHHAAEFDLDLGSDFVYMAAVLIDIKARCLLARDPELAKRERDPRDELVRQLLDYDQVRKGAEFLKQKLALADATWTRDALDEFRELPADGFPGVVGSLSLLEVLRLAQQALEAARTYRLIMPEGGVSDQEMMEKLEEILSVSQEALDGESLLANQPDGPHRMGMFLAMLEMAKSARLTLNQTECFGPITIRLSGMAQPCHYVDYGDCSL